MVLYFIQRWLEAVFSVASNLVALFTIVFSHTTELPYFRKISEGNPSAVNFLRAAWEFDVVLNSRQ